MCMYCAYLFMCNCVTIGGDHPTLDTSDHSSGVSGWSVSPTTKAASGGGGGMSLPLSHAMPVPMPISPDGGPPPVRASSSMSTGAGRSGSRTPSSPGGSRPLPSPGTRLAGSKLKREATVNSPSSPSQPQNHVRELVYRRRIPASPCCMFADLVLLCHCLWLTGQSAGVSTLTEIHLLIAQVVHGKIRANETDDRDSVVC